MSQAPADIDHLIALMSRLPGLGPRSARRAVLHLVKKRGQLLLPLADAMRALDEALAAARVPVLTWVTRRRWRTRR